jgi:hypothetical protein
MEKAFVGHQSDCKNRWFERRTIMKSYGKLTAWILGLWFLFALTAGALHVFRGDPNQPSIAVGLAAGTPIVLFFVWLAASKDFRQFALSLNPSTLTAWQTWRIIGFVFPLLEARGALPAIFAWPAGYGDIFIGATASLVAWKLANAAHRNSFILWQVLGITDLLTAVTLGITAGFLNPHGANMSAMTVLPLSLIPTFLVPLFLILHVICIAQALGWTAAGKPSRARAIQNAESHGIAS